MHTSNEVTSIGLHNVILCGGVGSRLWPLSRKSKPKQFIPLINGKSLLQLTHLRNKDLFKSCIVISNKAHRELVQSQLNGFEFTGIYESLPRNTAAAIAFAALSVAEEDILFVTPSDHMIRNDDAYNIAVHQAVELAMNGRLATIGIKPRTPETGFGYIESSGTNVLSFKEKPDAELADYFLKAGNYYWNSGMFCFRAAEYLKELRRLEPEIYNKCVAAVAGIQSQEVPHGLSSVIPEKSIDYAVIERSSNVSVVPGEFDWSDLGSFDSLANYLSISNSTDCNMIMSDRHVEIMGLKDIIVIDTNDALLIMPKGQSQDVKNIYSRLEAEKPELVL